MTRLTFTEFEAFAEAVEGASMTMRLSSLEEPVWTLRSASIGSLHLQQGYEGGGNVVEGVTSSDVWALYFPFERGMANGLVMTGNEVFSAPPGRDFCLVGPSRHEWLTLFIPTGLQCPSSLDLEFASFAKPQLLKPPPHVVRKYTSLVCRFLSAVESRPQLLDSPAAVDSYQSELLSAVKQLFTRCQRSGSRHFARWTRDAKSIVELAARHPDQSMSVSQLARQLGVPERTLRTAFQRCYGLSPLEYLRLHRLHQARRRLLASCPDETTVTQIAFGLGFWDLGRFAGAYRRLFKELPSETLRKPARESVDV